jgi:hypothetical protein
MQPTLLTGGARCAKLVTLLSRAHHRRHMPGASFPVPCAWQALLSSLHPKSIFVMPKKMAGQKPPALGQG